MKALFPAQKVPECQELVTTGQEGLSPKKAAAAHHNHKEPNEKAGTLLQVAKTVLFHSEPMEK